jgi:hypothetical protein
VDELVPLLRELEVCHWATSQLYRARRTDRISHSHVASVRTPSWTNTICSGALYGPTAPRSRCWRQGGAALSPPRSPLVLRSPAKLARGSAGDALGVPSSRSPRRAARRIDILYGVTRDVERPEERIDFDARAARGMDGARGARARGARAWPLSPGQLYI